MIYYNRIHNEALSEDENLIDSLIAIAQEFNFDDEIDEIDELVYEDLYEDFDDLYEDLYDSAS